MVDLYHGQRVLLVVRYAEVVVVRRAVRIDSVDSFGVPIVIGVEKLRLLISNFLS